MVGLERGDPEYQEIKFSDVSATFSHEELEGKDLVLIRAPAEFDIKCLKGKKYVPNGGINLNVQNADKEGTSESSLWNLDAYETEQARQLNLMLPSKSLKTYCKGQEIFHHLEVYRSFNLPPIQYPKVSKKIRKLAKPDDLTVRWAPFGAGDPSTKAPKKRKQRIQEDSESSARIIKKKKKKKNPEVEEGEEADAVVQSKKKKKKKQTEPDDNHSSPVKKKPKKKKNASEAD